jgi:hypothetical protein
MEEGRTHRSAPTENHSMVQKQLIYLYGKMVMNDAGRMVELIINHHDVGAIPCNRPLSKSCNRHILKPCNPMDLKLKKSKKR